MKRSARDTCEGCFALFRNFPQPTLLAFDNEPARYDHKKRKTAKGEKITGEKGDYPITDEHQCSNQ